MKKLNLKAKIYLILLIVFTILTFIGAGYVMINKGQVSAGYSVIPMLFAIISSGFYHQEINKDKSKKDK